MQKTLKNIDADNHKNLNMVKDFRKEKDKTMQLLRNEELKQKSVRESI